MFNAFRQVGGAIAIGIFGALIADRTQFISGMQASLTIAAAVLLTTVLISLRIRPTEDHHLPWPPFNESKEMHRCSSAPSAAAAWRFRPSGSAV